MSTQIYRSNSFEIGVIGPYLRFIWLDRGNVFPWWHYIMWANIFVCKCSDCSF